MNSKQVATGLLKMAKELVGGDFQYYTFESKGELHRNVLLNTLEDDYGITFRNYDLSTTGIRAKNSKTEKILSKLFK